MFKLRRDPGEHFLRIDQIEERRYEDIFNERYQLIYKACLRTIMRQDMSFERKMVIYGAQVRALICLVFLKLEDK